MVGFASFLSSSLESPCLRFPLTTRPTLNAFALRPLVAVGLIFFSSMPSLAPILPLDAKRPLNWLMSRVLLLCGAAGSAAVTLLVVAAMLAEEDCAAWPDTVRLCPPMALLNVDVLLNWLVLSASSLSLLSFRDFGLEDLARILGGASTPKSIPIPCIARAFRIGASGGSVENDTAVTPGASLLGWISVITPPPGPVGVSSPG